jgi:cell division cycle protein 37
VDTIGHEGFSKTVINKKPKAEAKALTEEERAKKLQEFTKANESLMKQFGLLKKYTDSRRFLLVSIKLKLS